MTVAEYFKQRGSPAAAPRLLVCAARLPARPPVKNHWLACTCTCRYKYFAEESMGGFAFENGREVRTSVCPQCVDNAGLCLCVCVTSAAGDLQKAAVHNSPIPPASIFPCRRWWSGSLLCSAALQTVGVWVGGRAGRRAGRREGRRANGWVVVVFHLPVPLLGW